VQFDPARALLGVYSWKVIALPRTATYPPEAGRMLSIVYCPWCGVELEAWRHGRPNPLEPHAQTLEESDAFLSAVLRDLRKRES
jgi:hypothetical protein